MYYNRLVMKTILVPTDFSLIAENALQYAIAVAKSEKAKIVLMHAYLIDSMYTLVAFPAYVIEQEMERAQQLANVRLKEVCRSVTRDNELECDHISMFGRPAECIRKAIKEVKPELVVMGTKGANTLSEKIFGSTTANIISKSGTQVLAIPSKAKYHDIQHIAFTADLDQRKSLVLKKLGELRSLFPTHISVIWIVADIVQKDACKKVLKQFKLKAAKKFGADGISYRLVTGKFAQDELFKLAKNKHYDLLSMITHQRSFLQTLTNQSMTRNVAKNLKVPLLAMQGE